MGAVIFCGREKLLIQHQQHAMQCFMVIRPLTGLPAEQGRQRVLRNGTQKEN